MSRKVNITSNIGQVTAPVNNPTKVWSVSDKSSFQIPEGAIEEDPNEVEFKGQSVNPHWKPGSEIKEGVQYKLSANEAIKMREEFVAKTSKPEEPPQRRLEMLIGFGASVRDCEVNFNGKKVVFAFRTLKSKEQREISAFIEQKGARLPDGSVWMKNEDRIELQITCLAYSLMMIDGVDVDVIIGSHNKGEEEKLEYRKAYLDEIDDELKRYLFDCFDSLVADHKMKYVPSTVEQAQEVAESISKSS